MSLAIAGVDFRRDIAERFSREELLEFIETQNPHLIKEINRIEYVFKYKLKHILWETGPNRGEPIDGKPLTTEELALLIDEPFQMNVELTRLGLNEDQQRQIHISRDPVLWARAVLHVQPRAYQIMFLRHDSVRRALRQGRRSGKSYSMSIYMLWWGYTHNNAKIIVVTPQKEQGAVLYKALLEMVQNSEVVGSSIRRKVTSPQHAIELSNGSTLKFFSSGVNSGGKANVVRGQEAHLLILDEMDYMHPDDIDSLMAMMQKTEEGQDEKVLICASTPTGQRTTPFYVSCHNPYFKEFWVPALANPHWSKEMEEELRNHYSENAYRHEIEADWGEDAMGVYQRKYLDMAFIDQPVWKYEDQLRSARSFYVMGVDWDKHGAGCNFVVLEVCSADYEIEFFRNKVRCVWREETPKEEFTYLNAIDRIVELHRRFNFRHIYIDRGAGEVQGELLHRYGIEHPETGLRKVVKAYQFGESIEVRDPENHEKSKKRLKPFMVDNLVQMLEKNYLFFPSVDEELYLQLSAYVVERVSILNEPTFGTNGIAPDHAHDALILACLAITLNYGDLMKSNIARYAKIISGEVFQNLLTMENAAEEAMAEDKWGSTSAAPVLIRRRMSALGGRRGAIRPIQRKMF